MSISLIIPAYNEEKRIIPFLASIASFHTKNPGVLYEVLVVDDGSNDTTARVSKQAGSSLPRFQVISLKPNQGKGAAIQAGVLAATGEYIVFMDADGATAITEMPKMIDALHGYDIAIGSRWLEGATMERHSFLRSLSGYMNRTYMQLFGFKDIDTMCGFKGYKKEVARDLFKDLEEKRWLFDTEIAYRALCRNYRIHNFPIMWESKDGSKLDTKTLLTSALHILPLILRIRSQETISRS